MKRVSRICVEKGIEDWYSNSGELELGRAIDGLENAWIDAARCTTCDEGCRTSDEACGSNDHTESLGRRTTY